MLVYVHVYEKIIDNGRSIILSEMHRVERDVVILFELCFILSELRVKIQKNYRVFHFFSKTLR